MPRRLPERTRQTERNPRRFGGLKFNPSPQLIPVSEGQEMEVVIDDIGSRGDGIVRIQGFLIFVSQAKMGERLKVKIVRVGTKFAIAEKIK